MVSPGPAATPAAQPETAKPKPRDIRAMNSVRAIREELDRLKDVAVMTPTPENVRRFLDAQQFVMEKGAVFADVARRVVWASPDLTTACAGPPKNAAIQTWKIQRQADEGRKRWRRPCAAMGSTSSCAVTVPTATSWRWCSSTWNPRMGWKFSRKPDGGRTARLSPHPGRITASPACSGVHRARPVSDATGRHHRQRTHPLGQGMLSADEIVQRIHVLTRTRPGKVLRSKP